LQQLVGYLRHSGRDGNVVVEAARDPKPTLIHFGFGGPASALHKIRPIGRAVEGRDASEDVFAPIRWRCLRNSYVMDAMRAPKHLYVLAAGLLITVAYLFSVSGFLYALCVAALMIVVVAYLFSLNYLMDYLRRFHTATWAHLGRPSFSTIAEHTANPSRFVQSGLLTLRFIFSTGYKSLEDERLNQLIWLIRILLACGVAGTIVLGISETK
jgi:hypothetical protein